MAQARRTTPQQTQPTWFPLALSTLGCLGGAALLYFGYPGVVFTWLLVLIGAWTAPPAQYTGKKDASGFPTAAHAGETQAMLRYRFWTDLKFHLLMPSGLFVPGWPIYVSWVLGLWAGAVVWCLPAATVLDITQPWVRHVNAVLAVVLVVQICAARRRTVVAGDVSPGVTFWFLTGSKIRDALRERSVNLGRLTGRAYLLAAGSLAATGSGAFTASLLPMPSAPVDHGFIWPLLGGIGGFALAIGPWWLRRCLSPWRTLVDARAEWAPRWLMLKHDPAPFLVEREQIGGATVDTFTAPGSMGSMAYLPLGQKITPTMGSGQRIAVLSVPNTDSSDQPQPGTRHPLDFKIAYWPADQTPDVTDLDADPDEVALFFQAAMVWAADEEGYARPILDQVIPIALTGALEGPAVDPAELRDSEEKRDPADETSQRQAWGSMWLLPDGPPWDYIRNALSGPLSKHLGCQVLVDHRNQFLYAGGLTDGSTVFDPATGVEPESLANLVIEDEWNARWADALKRDANPPRPDHATRADAQLPNGQTVYRQAFVTRQGVDPTEFFGLESKVAATLSGAPFVAITGWPSQGRAGERHAQAFTVYWSAQSVPANPDQLAPASRRTDSRVPPAQQWVLAGRVAEAFKAARLAKPETYEARCLTQPASRGHIWRIALRLYGGVTLADVRGAADRIRQALGSEWLRVESAPDGCTLVVGASPSKVQLGNPKRDEHYIASLNWEQAFLDAKVFGVGHLTPTLQAVDRLPHNQQVQVLDFTLPEGLAFVDVKAARAKLETSSHNAFVEVLRHPSGKAGLFRMLASEVNPMPEAVGFDFAAADTNDHRIPFATGLTGEPVCYDNEIDPMILVSGMPGGGKAQPLNTVIPVPVSPKYPTGRATVGELEIGDKLFTADGSITTVTTLFPIYDQPVHRLTLSDGRVVEASADHLWNVSTKSSRRSWTDERADSRTRYRSAMLRRAEHVRAKAAEISPELVMTLTDISVLAGLGPSGIYNIGLSLEHLSFACQSRSNRRARVIEVETLARHVDHRVGQACGYVLSGERITNTHVQVLRDAAAKMDGWLTVRACADALFMCVASQAQLDTVRQLVARLRPRTQRGVSTRTTRVYPVDEVMSQIATHFEHMARRSSNGMEPQPLLRLLSTADMLHQGVEKSQFAVPIAAISGEWTALALDPYTLGAWLGDGTARTGAITSADPMVICRVERAGFPVRRVEDRSPNGKARVYHFEGLASALQAAGIQVNQSHPPSKRIPPGYLRSSRSQRLELLQGLMDTDGTIGADGGSELSLSDTDLATDALELVRSLGIKASVSWNCAAGYRADDGRPIHCKNRHRIKFTTDQPVFKLPRKAKRLPSKRALRATSEWAYIRSIEVVARAPMRCIKVADPSHTYLTADFVPTHNSVWLQNLIFGAAIRGWDLWVADPSKNAVDFNFAEPYAKAVARDVWQARGLMESVYAEVTRRKQINSKYDCGNYRDLPDEARYNHVLVVLDEFTSLMIPEPLPKIVDDSPASQAQVEMLKAVNAAKAYIGTYVGKMVREARSTGFTVVLATQALKAKTLDQIPNASDLKDLMSRGIMGRASFAQLQTALKAATEAPPQPDVLPQGRGLYEGNGRTAEFIQVWFERHQTVFAEQLAARRGALPECDRLDMNQFVEPDVEVDGAPIGALPRIAPAHGDRAETTEVLDLGVVELALDDDVDWDAMAAEIDDDDGAAADDGDVPASSSPEESAEPGFGLDPDVSDSQPDSSTDPVDGFGSRDHRHDTDLATEPEPGMVTVAEQVAWDQIDPSTWEPAESAYEWTEVDALLGFLTEFPQVKSVAWSDIRLSQRTSTGSTFRALVAELLAERGVMLSSQEPASSSQGGVEAATETAEDEFGTFTRPAAPTPKAMPSHRDDEFAPLPKARADLVNSDDF